MKLLLLAAPVAAYLMVTPPFNLMAAIVLGAAVLIAILSAK